MSKTIEITKKICMEPKDLNENLEKNLIEKIKRDMIGKCDQKHGYVHGVEEKITILDNIVSTASPVVFFTVKIRVTTVRPVVGDVHEGKVCTVFLHGIFVEILNRVKVLIPSSKLTGFTYNKSLNLFSNGENDITTGCELSVVITAVKYEKGNFSCIGGLSD